MPKAKPTPGPWQAEHRPDRDPTRSHAVVIDEQGNELFDTLNRGYKRSLVEQDLDDEDHRYYDTAGMMDLQLAAAAHELLEALKDEVDPIVRSGVIGPCQKGLMPRCRCDECRLERARAAIAKAEGDS